MLIVDRVTKSYRTLAASCRFSPAFRCRWSAARRSRSWGHRAAEKARSSTFLARSKRRRQGPLRSAGRIPSGWASASRRLSGTAKSASSSRTIRCRLSARCSRTCWRRRSWLRRPRMVPTRPPRAPMLLTQVGLGDRLDHRPAELSGGETAGRACAGAHSEPGAAALRRAHRQPRSCRRRHGCRSAVEAARGPNTILVVVTTAPALAARFPVRYEMNGGLVGEAIRDQRRRLPPKGELRASDEAL